MKLELNTIENYLYDEKKKFLPIVIGIFSENQLEIAQKVDLMDVILFCNKTEVLSTHYICRFGLPKKLRNIDCKNPYFLHYDLYELLFDDGQNIPAGEYTIYFKLKVYVNLIDGGFKEILLENEKNIIFTQMDT
jgi:hypothetical protein